MSKRTSKTDWFLDLALRCAYQGTCLRRNFGAIIVDVQGTIVSTGYTGTCRGVEHCTSCLREKYHIPSGQRYELCLSVHAEQNAIMQAGKATRGSTLYLAGYDVKTENIVGFYPCFLCAKMILNSGIVAVCVLQSDKTSKWYQPYEVYNNRLKEIDQVLKVPEKFT